uniref:L-dopachrome isomerase n=1 Tax=Cacopsylla melanoneura TaxID=428564 RepID=A0A8D8UJL5_9HEMI
MPVFRLETNIPKDKIPANFGKETGALVAKTLGKPESYVAVIVAPDTNLTFGGSDGPAGIASLMSIGKLGTAENKKHSAVLFAHVEKSLGIPKDRLYISYIDSPTDVVGYNGTTFHDIFGG